MTIQTFEQTLIEAQAAGPPLVNSAVATTILPGHARYTLPANFFKYTGQTLRFTASGIMSTVVTTPGTLAITINFGTLAVPITVFVPAAMALNIVAQTNATWLLEVNLTCRSIGQATAATMLGTGKFFSRATLGQPIAATQLGVGTVILPDTGPVVGAGFDSTITNVIDLVATFSIANAANSITLNQYTVESIN